MSLHDLKFTTNADSDGIFDPLLLTSTGVEVTLTNYGNDTLSNLGFFVVPATYMGDIDNPADFPPESDYQDLIEWGTATDLGLAVQGGLKITSTRDSVEATQYVTRSKGAIRSNKILIDDLSSGASTTFTLLLETPPGVSSRRLFIDLVVE